MIITNGAALWLALLIPVVVFAYFIRRKIRRRVVSAMFLWDEALNSALAPVRGFRVRNLLALILALLVTLALITSLVNPIVGNAGRVGDLALVLDNSASMSARDANGQTRLQNARELADRIVANKPDEREILVLTTAPDVEIVSGFSKDFAALRRRLERVAPSNQPSELRAALEKAKFFQRARGENAKVIVLSDFACKDADEIVDEINRDPALAAARIGAPVDNLALLNLVARRSPNGDPTFETLVDVANYSDTTAEFNVELELNGELLDILPLELAANERAQKIVTNSSELGGTLRARIVPLALDFNDASPLDDERETTLLEFPALKIKLFGDRDLFLETVLEAQPNATVERVAQPPQTLANDELLIISGQTPSEIPNGAVAIIAPTASCNLFELGDEIPETALDGEPLDEGLARYLKFNGQTLRGVRKVTIANGYETSVYAQAPEAPVLFEMRNPTAQDSGRVFVLNFATAESDIGLKTLFPILFANLVGEARGYNPDETFSRALAAPDEANLRRELELTDANTELATTAGRAPIWLLCAAFALLVAAVEFYLFCRRRVE